MSWGDETKTSYETTGTALLETLCAPYAIKFGQTFAVAGDRLHTGGGFKFEAGSAGTVTIALYATTGGLPTGTALASQKVAVAGAVWVRSQWETLVSAGTSALVIDAVTGKVFLRCNSAGGYTGGTRISHAGSWDADSSDALFHSYARTFTPDLMSNLPRASITITPLNGGNVLALAQSGASEEPTWGSTEDGGWTDGQVEVYIPPEQRPFLRGAVVSFDGPSGPMFMGKVRTYDGHTLSCMPWGSDTLRQFSYSGKWAVAGTAGWRDCTHVEVDSAITRNKGGTQNDSGGLGTPDGTALTAIWEPPINAYNVTYVPCIESVFGPAFHVPFTDPPEWTAANVDPFTDWSQTHNHILTLLHDPTGSNRKSPSWTGWVFDFGEVVEYADIAMTCSGWAPYLDLIGGLPVGYVRVMRLDSSRKNGELLIGGDIFNDAVVISGNGIADLTPTEVSAHASSSAGLMIQIYSTFPFNLISELPVLPDGMTLGRPGPQTIIECYGMMVHAGGDSSGYTDDNNVVTPNSLITYLAQDVASLSPTDIGGYDIAADSTNLEPFTVGGQVADILSAILDIVDGSYGWECRLTADKPTGAVVTPPVLYYDTKPTVPEYFLVEGQSETGQVVCDIAPGDYDAMYSAVRVNYTDDDGVGRYVLRYDTDPTHYLVNVGRCQGGAFGPRWAQALSIGNANATIAAAAGDLFLSVVGADTWTGTITVRGPQPGIGGPSNPGGWPCYMRPGKLASVQTHLYGLITTRARVISFKGKTEAKLTVDNTAKPSDLVARMVQGLNSKRLSSIARTLPTRIALEDRYEKAPKPDKYHAAVKGVDIPKV